jgi:trimeric autotransporter adhesin
MRFTPETPAPPSPRTLLTALLIASFLITSASAEPASRLAAARAAAERAEALWRQARGLDALSDGRVPASTARVNPDDVHWQNRYGLPVPDGPIEALLPYRDRLIVGGGFSRIGDLLARGIAAWDGSAWSELPGFPGGSVIELALYGDGFVALTSGPPGVWRWDGAAWHALEDLPAAWNVFDMAVLDDRIAVSYQFPSSAQQSRVLLHGPGGWTQLGGDFDGGVYALAWYAGELYAGGSITQAGGGAAPLVARWDGNAWQAISGDLPTVPPYAWVTDLAVAGGELVVCGSLGLLFDGQVHDVARWDGTRWASLDWVSTSAYPTRLRTIGNDLYALGHFPNGYRSHGIVRWDGAAWHMDEDRLQSWVNDVATFGGDLYAGGSLFADDSRPTTPLSRRHNGVWQASILPASSMSGLLGTGPVRDLETMGGQVFACGDFQLAGSSGGWRRCLTTARWDGLQWMALGMESWVQAYAHDLVVHEGTLYAVGSFIPDESGNFGAVAHLVGDRWESVAQGSPQRFLNAYCATSALGELIIGGYSGTNPFHGIAGWDGQTWHPIGGGITGDETALNTSWIMAVAQHGADLIAAGKFSEMGGVPCANIAAWNPATGWRPLGSGLDREVVSLLSRDGVLYAAGSFKTAGGIPVQGIAQWRNGAWAPLPPLPLVSPYYWQMFSLGWFHGQLAVSADGLPGSVAILEADGGWHPLGSGLSAPPLAFAENGPSLYLGGYFSAAGGKPSYGFAEWRDGPSVPPASVPQVSAAPNPFATDVHLRYELPAVAFARIEIFDLAGHRVDRVFEGYQGAGPQDVVWSPLRSRARPGVYFAQLVIDGKSRTVSVVRIP